VRRRKEKPIRVELLQLLANGLTLKECAERGGCSIMTVVRTREKAEKSVEKLLKEGKSVEDIVRQTGFPRDFVVSVVKKMAYTIPVKGLNEGTVPFKEPFIVENERREGEGGNSTHAPSVRENFLSSSGENSHKGGDKVNGNSEQDSTILLRGLLKRVRGISDDTIESICQFFDENSEVYEQNPSMLLGLLEAMGVKPTKAMFIVSQFLSALHGVPPGFWYPGQPGQMQGQTVPIWPVQPQPSPHRESSSKEVDEWFRRYLQAATIQMLRGGGFGGSVIPPYATVVQEPVVDATGKPVKDEFGNYVVKTVITPAIPASKKEESKGEGSKLAEEIAKLEKQRADALEAKLLEVLKTHSDEVIKDLRQQVIALASRNPLAEAEDIIKRLKEMGLFAPGTPNIEIAKMNAELQKWMHEQNMQFKRWQEEMKEKRLERQEALARAKMFGETLRQGIADLGKPLISAFVEGYRSGGGARSSSSNPSSQVKGLKLSSLSDQELLKLKQEAEETIKTVSKVAEEVEKELKSRTPPSQ